MAFSILSIINHLNISLLILNFCNCFNIFLLTLFISGEYFHSDFGFHQATQLGWRRLLTGFEHQITRLVLEDCDLDNEHFRLLVQSCKVLEHLNVVNNSQINDYSPLRTHISPRIRVLKVGPKLGVTRQQIRSLLSTHLLINDILQSDRCVALSHLQLHCLLSSRLVTLVKLPCLKRFTLKFVSFSTVAEGISSHETDILNHLLLLSPRSNIKHLHFYQVSSKRVVKVKFSLRNKFLLNFFSSVFYPKLSPLS